MKEQELTPANTPISWSGNFPQNYEDNLKFIFGPYAEDLAAKIDQQSGHLLELACGTGQVTYWLSKKLSPDVTIQATDLSPEMMTIPKNKIDAPNIIWDDVDMCAIPYQDEMYDTVVCQFGIMFAPDKSKAFNEIYRVLKPGGRLLFSTWGLPSNNRVFQIFNQTLVDLMDFDFAAAPQGPFSMWDDQAVLGFLVAASFANIKVEQVSKTGESATASQAAKGFFQGSPLAANLKANNPALGEKIQGIAEREFINQLGDNPMRTPLQAWVFEAFKQ